MGCTTFVQHFLCSVASYLANLPALCTCAKGLGSDTIKASGGRGGGVAKAQLEACTKPCALTCQIRPLRDGWERVRGSVLYH